MAIMNVDFFRAVELGSGSLIDLAALFTSLAGADDDDPTRYVSYAKSHFIRLYRISRWRSAWVGDFVRIRMDDIPVKAGLKGPVAPFQLDDEEGVGEPTAFLYDPRLRVLALQRNKFGVNPGGVSWFVDQVSGTSIRLVPVLKTDGIERLMRLRRVAAIDVHFAGVQDPGRLRTGGSPPSVRTMSTLLTQFGAASASIRLTAGRGGWSLNVGEAAAAARELVNLSERAEVTKVEVTGTDDDEEKDVLDLLKLKLTARVPIEGSNNTRSLEFADRLQALQAAWTRSVGDLNLLFEQ